MLRINFVLEKEVVMYEDDPCILWDKHSDGDTFFKGFKIDDAIYNYVEYAESLGDAKRRLRAQLVFSKFSKKFVKTIFGYLFEPRGDMGIKEVLICNYCSGSAVGEAYISLRKITIYGRPPIGAKDMKIKINKSSYIYNTRNVSAYCKKCGLQEIEVYHV